MKLNKNSKHRGVSEVITTVMLLAITVVGGAFVAVWISDSEVTDVTNVAPAMTASSSALSSIKLMSYDARDFTGLSQITGLDNNFDNDGDTDGELCTNTCVANPNFIPANDGTDFIVLGIKNNGLDQAILRTVFVNDQPHVWDDNTANQVLSLVGSYPIAGTFSIVDATGSGPLTQHGDETLLSNEEVRLVIKLDETVGDGNDLAVNNPLRILIDTDRLESEIFIISIGTAR